MQLDKSKNLSNTRTVHEKFSKYSLIDTKIETLATHALLQSKSEKVMQHQSYKLNLPKHENYFCKKNRYRSKMVPN